MKKIYMLFIGALFTSSAFAQFATQPAQGTRMVQTKRVASETPVLSAGERNVFWSNDFSNCAEWEIDNAYDNGFTQFVEDLNWVCGTAAPSGPAAIDAINSTTAANGFMMVDSDAYGGEEGGTVIENCWFQNAEPIDCSDHPFVSVKFENQYYKWDSGNSDGNEKCLVEVSRDGVTWPSVDTWDEIDGFVDYGDGPVQARWDCFPDMQTQDPVDNTTILIFDITSVAGGADEVYIRFRWKGIWGYAWMVDDIDLFPTPDDDISIEGYATYTDFEGTGLYEYGVFHTSQLTELQMAARVRNLGVNDAENVTLSASVNGDDVSLNAVPLAIPYATIDTVRASGYTPPAVAGLYDVELTVTQDALDEFPENNVALNSFEVSETHFARDNGEYSGFFPAATYQGEFQVANGYQFFSTSTIYAIDVAFVAGEEEAPIQAHILDGNLDIVFSSDELELNPAFLNTDPQDNNITWYTFALENPVTVQAGEFWLASVESFGGSGLRLGRSKAAPAQTCFVFGDFGAAGFDWYFTGATAMVRFNFDEDAASTPVNVENIAYTGFELLQNIPNPATGVTRIRYNMEISDRVSLEVMDITGKRVFAEDFGQLPVGEHQYELNISNLASGLYTYTLNVGQQRATRKMIVK